MSSEATKNLYKYYSDHFAGIKAFLPELQFEIYEQQYLQLPITSARIGDLGCGRGEWLLWLKRKGFPYLTGFDCCREDLMVLRENAPEVDCREGDVMETLADMEEKFHLLHAKDLIEHLPKGRVVELLRTAKRALVPGGEFWILTFNAQSPLSSATRYGDYTHEVGFTPTSMLQVLRASGFSQLSIRGVHTCSHGWRGRMRSWLGSLVYGIARLLIILRHGRSASIEGVDLYTAKPDLLVVVRKEKK